MNYIELFGISYSGKTFVKNKLIKELKNKNKKIYDKESIIINFFFNNCKRGFLFNFKLILLIFFHLKFVKKIRLSLKRKNKVKKVNNKIIFTKSKKTLFYKIIDMIKLGNDYNKILDQLEKKLKIEDRYPIYNFIKKEINLLKQHNDFKIQIKKWFLENLILIDILKKYKNTYCVMDEGIIHKIFIIFSLKKNKKEFLKKIISLKDNYNKLYLIKPSLEKIKTRLTTLDTRVDGFIYKNNKQIEKEYSNLIEFEKLISKKIKYKIITN